MASTCLRPLSKDMKRLSSLLRTQVLTRSACLPATIFQRQTHSHTLNHVPLVSQVRSKSIAASPAAAEASPRIDEGIVLGETNMTVTGLDKALNYIWLRENCRCNVCYNHDIFQKNLHPHHIDADIRPESALLRDGELHLVWPDGHKSNLSMDWIRDNSYPPRAQHKVERYYWDNTMLSLDDIPHIDFKDFMESDEAKKVGVGQTTAKQLSPCRPLGCKAHGPT